MLLRNANLDICNPLYRNYSIFEMQFYYIAAMDSCGFLLAETVSEFKEYVVNPVIYYLLFHI